MAEQAANTALTEPKITSCFLTAADIEEPLPRASGAMGTGRPAPLPGTAPSIRTLAVPGPVLGTRAPNSLAEEGVQAVCSHVYYVHLQNLKGNKLKKNTTERNLGCRFLPRRHHNSQVSSQFSRAGRRTR